MTSWNVSEVSGVNLGLFGGFGKLVTLVSDGFEKRRSVAAMQGLDARMLADIGVERYEIEAVVYGADNKTAGVWSLGSVFTALVRRFHRAQAIRQLAALPDHLLADIGVERAMIGDLVDRRLAEAEERKSPANLAQRDAVAKDEQSIEQTLSRIDPALLAKAGYKHGRMGWQPVRQATTANANEHKGKRAA